MFLIDEIACLRIKKKKFRGKGVRGGTLLFVSASLFSLSNFSMFWQSFHLFVKAANSDVLIYIKEDKR